MDDDLSSARQRSGTAGTTRRQQLLAGLRNALATWSAVHLKGFLDKLDRELLRLADHAGNNADQSRYWQTRAELVSHRGSIERRMSDRLRDAFQAFVDRRDTWAAESGSAALEASGAALQLMEDAHLERSLAIDTMSRRVAADCSEALYALHQRLSVLAAGQKVTEQGNPVAPRVFAETLDFGFADLAIDNRARLLIYKFYDLQLMQRLGKLYELLNHHLKSAGVLPNLQYTIERQSSGGMREPTGSANAASQRRQYQLMALIQQLQVESGGQQAAGNAGFGVGAGAGMPQSLAVLAGLQRSGAAQLQAAGSIDALIAGGKASRRQLESQARDLDVPAVEIVGLLFECMLNEELLPDSVKALLSYLHTPFLKVAVSDRAFLNIPQHPARQLLNCLVAAGERWVEPDGKPDGKNRNEVFQQIRRVVQRVLSEFDDDAALFSELLTEFNSALYQYAQRIERAEQRAREIARGEDRLREGRQQVELFLQRRCAGVPLTAAARELLFGPWAHYQAFVWLRFGTDSAAWEEASDAVDALIHYLGPRRKRDEDLERVLLAGLRDGLEMVGYDQVKGDALLAALAQSRDDDTVAEPVPVVEPPPLEVDEDAELSALLALGFGTWFVFDANLPRRQQRLKLAWYNDRTLRFMFVNRLGQQVMVKQGVELAQELRDGRTRLLDDLAGRPFFEKALERIVHQLKGGEGSLAPAASPLS